MKKILFVIVITILNSLFISHALVDESQYFNDAKKFFKKRDLEKSKFLFEKDIVFNPKNEMSYLYLAKIFKINENDAEQEMNLNTVLLLNPKNEEALYILMKLKIKQSNFDETKDLLKKFELVCDLSCEKSKEIKSELKSLSPEG